MVFEGYGAVVLRIQLTASFLCANAGGIKISGQYITTRITRSNFMGSLHKCRLYRDFCILQYEIVQAVFFLFSTLQLLCCIPLIPAHSCQELHDDIGIFGSLGTISQTAKKYFLVYQLILLMSKFLCTHIPIFIKHIIILSIYGSIFVIL